MSLPRQQYLNLHAHRFPASENEWVLTNLRAMKDPIPEDFSSAYYSIGLHPWDVKSADVDEAMQIIYDAAGNPKVLAIGECGLDKQIDLSLKEQVTVFERQIEIAVSLEKPLVIHSVKSTLELLSCKKRHPKSIPWIIHGYRGGWQQASELLRGGFYLSVGDAVCRMSKVQEMVAQIPLERLFIETDESNTAIEEIYAKVCELRSLDIESLQDHMIKKFLELFNLTADD